jgi:hypothetical protein
VYTLDASTFLQRPGIAAPGLGTAASRSSHTRIWKEVHYRTQTIEAVMVATLGA